MELLENDLSAYSLGDVHHVLSKIVAHHNSMQHIETAKSDASADKQHDGKDTKKKGDKSAVANPAMWDGAASAEPC